MRYRVNDQMTSIATTYIDKNGSCISGNDSSVDHACGLIGQKVETWDVVTPRYYARRRAGEIIVNPYTNIVTTRTNSINGIRSTSDCGGGVTQVQDRLGPQLTYLLNPSNSSVGYLTPPNLISADRIQRATSLAATQAWASVQQGDAQLLVFIAELKKTIAMLVNPLENVNRFLRKIRLVKNNVPRGHANRSLTVLEFLTREWLRYRYGVMPLVYDIQSLLKAASRARKSGWETGRGFSSDREQTTFPEASFRHGQVDTYYQDTAIDELKVKCGLIYWAEMHPRDWFGVNPRAIPDAVWELIHFSFVVDWFLNVQTYIRGISAYASVPVSGSFTVLTRTRSIIRQVTRSALWTGTSTLVRQGSGAESCIIRSKERVNTVLDPSLVHKINLSKFDFRDKRVLDSIALLFGLLHLK